MERPMHSAGWNPTWVLVYTSFLMMILRLNAGPVIKKFGPLGLLAMCSALAIVGLNLLSFASTVIFVFFAATLYGISKTYFWPTMLGLVAEQTPKGGALTLNAIAGIGMLTVGILGGPFIGYLQESTVSSKVEEMLPDSYPKLVQQNDYLLGSYNALDMDELSQQPEAIQTQVNMIMQKETQGALAKMAWFPAFMLICF